MPRLSLTPLMIAGCLVLAHAGAAIAQQPLLAPGVSNSSGTPPEPLAPGAELAEPPEEPATQLQSETAASALAAGPFTPSSTESRPPTGGPEAPSAEGTPRDPVSTSRSQAILAPGGAPEIESLPLRSDPGTAAHCSYFSPRLGARFIIQPQSLPQFGQFWGAQLVSEPLPGSPLQQLGIGEGDIITRLDGLPVRDSLELERHVFATSVRFLCPADGQVQIGWMEIHPDVFFFDPMPRTTHGGGCRRAVVLRP